MAKWIDIGPADNFPEGTHVRTTAGEKPIVVAHVEGELHAMRDECPHAGQPIGMGDLHGCILTCPFHGYAYNVKTGRNVDFPHDEPPVKKYPVRITDNTVQVQLET
ncbi:MAG: Rieske (2Fe-2S) protein [Phycisphaeraceae bacterium]